VASLKITATYINQNLNTKEIGITLFSAFDLLHAEGHENA